MDSGSIIRESDIGIGVFGRQPGYDTALDPLVRVQVSQLRKKLQQYFAVEGINEPVIIEIPKGGYTPVFTVRPHKDEPAEHTADGTELVPGARFRRLAFLLGLITAVSLAVAAWGLLRPTRSWIPVRPGAESGPESIRLWRQMFANGRPTAVVLSDPSLVEFETMIHYQLTLNEYRGKDFTRLGLENLPDQKKRDEAHRLIVSNVTTHAVDAQLAAVFSVLNASQQVPTDVVWARDFGVAYVHTHNLILLGSRRANPWMEPFEQQLNFRSVFQETEPPVSYFENVSPKPGEKATYLEEWGFVGYCRVAYFQNPTRTANILLISGSDMASTEAGGQFISSEAWIQTLRSTLGLKNGDRFPYFEVLLRAEYVARNTTPRFSLIAFRVTKP